MAALCRMPTIQYSARRVRISVLKLFTSGIRRGLVSRDSIVDGDWLPVTELMSVLSAVLSTRVGRRRKFGEVSCTDCICQKNDFELIPTVEIETRNHTDGYFRSEFPAICILGYGGLKSQDVKFFENVLGVFWKNDPYGKIFKILF